MAKIHLTFENMLAVGTLLPHWILWENVQACIFGATLPTLRSLVHGVCTIREHIFGCFCWPWNWHSAEHPSSISVDRSTFVHDTASVATLGALRSVVYVNPILQILVDKGYSRGWTISHYSRSVQNVTIIAIRKFNIVLVLLCQFCHGKLPCQLRLPYYSDKSQ